MASHPVTLLKIDHKYPGVEVRNDNQSRAVYSAMIMGTFACKWFAEMFMDDFKNGKVSQMKAFADYCRTEEAQCSGIRYDQ